MNGQPYISVVATSRNDDHGGSLSRRMQIFVNGWIEQCKRHNLPSELILVEWNPPPDRAPLAEALRWPSDTHPCDVRVVTVPTAIHRRYKYSESLPLFQMIAKNVGIRRARAPFVLVTNIDILFNDELFSFLSSKRLEKGRMYRIDRHDAETEVPLGAPVIEQLAYCQAHLLRVNAREGTFPTRPANAATALPEDAADPHSGIRFGEGFGLVRKTAGEPFRWSEREGVLFLPQPPSKRRVLRFVLEPGPGIGQTLLEICDAESRRLARLAFRERKRVYLTLPPIGADGLALRFDTKGTDRRQWGLRRLRYLVSQCGWASAEELMHEAPDLQADGVSHRLTYASDVYDYDQSILLCGGWGERDWTPSGRLFRKASNGASFLSYVPKRLSGRLVLDFEPEDPSLPLELVVKDETGREVVRRLVRRCDRIEIPPPRTARGRRVRFSIYLKRHGKIVDEQSNDTALRVFGLRWKGALRRIRNLLLPWLTVGPSIERLHTNACGDFTLMHRDHWIRLRGYPEWEAYSMNIDGFTCYAAHCDGAHETVLEEPMRIYHIEHSLGSGWSPEGENQLYERITAKGIRWISAQQIEKHARRMYREGPLVCNSEDWGLAREALVEASTARPVDAPDATLRA